MSQPSNVSSLEEESLEEESDYADSERSHLTTSSLSRCNSSSSIVDIAVQTEKNRESSTSLETGWTDSKHSSYLDLMEANFVKNMYGRSYCVEDVCGKKSDHDHQYEHQYTETEEGDNDDSAQSRLHMPFETMEFKTYDRGDWTWRPVSKPMVPAGVPWVLLKNPWVKHFRPKNSSRSSSRPIPSTLSSSVKDAAGSEPKKSTISLNTVSSTLLSSRKDEAGRGDVLSRDMSSPKIIGNVEYHQIVNTHHDIASSSNPSSEGSKTKFAAFGRGNDDLEAGQIKERILQSFPSVDACVSNSKKRALWSTSKQMPRSRQKTDNKDDATPPNLILDSASERLGKLVEES